MDNLWLQVLPTFGAFRQVPWRRLKVTTDGYELTGGPDASSGFHAERGGR